MTGYIPKPPFPFLNRGYPLSNGLLGAWPMAEGSGDITSDLSGNGKTATLINSPVWGGSCVGSAIQFVSASTQSVYVGPMPELAGIAHLTVIATIKKDASNKTVSLGSNDSSARNGWFMLANTTGDFTCAVRVNSAPSVKITINDALCHRVALVFDGEQTGDLNRLKIFKDGIDGKASVVNSGVPATTSPVSNNTIFGRLGENTSNDSDGQIADVRIYNRTLSPAEISEDYRDAFRIYRLPSVSSWIGGAISAPVVTGPPLGSLNLLGVGR